MTTFTIPTIRDWHLVIKNPTSDPTDNRIRKMFTNSRRNHWPKQFPKLDYESLPFGFADHRVDFVMGSFFAVIGNHIDTISGNVDESALCCNVHDDDLYSDWVGEWKENYSELSNLIRFIKRRHKHLDTHSVGYVANHNRFESFKHDLTKIANKMLISRSVNKMARKYITGER